MGGQYDYDWIIVGSGFGGSVSALRLAEKGYKVAVLESQPRIPIVRIQNLVSKLPQNTLRKIAILVAHLTLQVKIHLLEMSYTL